MPSQPYTTPLAGAWQHPTGADDIGSFRFSSCCSSASNLYVFLVAVDDNIY